MFKKFLVFLCIAVFSLASFNGCSKKDQDATEQVSTSDSTSVAPDSAGVTIQVPDTTKTQ